MKARLGWVVPAIAAWLVALAVGGAFIKVSSATYDEPVHLASGYAGWRLRPLNWRDHPPLGEMWGAVPLLRLNPAAMPQAQATMKLYDFADVFLYKNTVDAARMLNAARWWCLATWMALLLAVVGAWAFSLGGTAAAVFACAAAALMPTLVSNAALVTTDAASAVLFTLTFFLLSRERRTAWVWAAAGAAMGFAMASKFSLFVVPGFAAAALLTEARLKGAPCARARDVFLLTAAALAGLWLVYARWGLDLWWEGLRLTLTRLDQGRASFLAGRRSLTGFWWYFPAALFLKTPAASLLLAAGAAAAWLRRPGRAAFWVLFPSCAFFVLACASKTQLGVRYILPVYPFLCVAAGWGASRLWTWGLRGRALALALLGWQAWSVSRAVPDQLSYFTDLVGGPAAGVRWLGDSNLDWGQGLQELGEELSRRGSPAIYLSYFGAADPSYYGIRYLPVGWITSVQRREPQEPRPKESVLLAVSATNLQGIYFADPDTWAWLKTRAPVYTAGHSIFLYDLTADADARRHLASLVAASGFPGPAARLVVQ